MSEDIHPLFRDRPELYSLYKILLDHFSAKLEGAPTFTDTASGFVSRQEHELTTVTGHHSELHDHNAHTNISTDDHHEETHSHTDAAGDGGRLYGAITDTEQKFEDRGSDPSGEAGYAKLYAKDAGGGVLRLYTVRGDGTVDGPIGAAGTGHTIRENGVDQTSRTGLNFVDTDAGAGLITDDAGGNETEVNLNLYVLKTNTSFVDLTDGGATTLHSHSGGSGHTIQDDNAAMTARTNLSFQDGFVLTDDAGGDQTEIDLSYAGTGDLANPALTEAAGTALTVARGDHVHGFAGFIWMPIADWFIGGPMRTDASNHLGKIIKIPDYATAVAGLTLVCNLVTAPTGSAANFDIKYSTTFAGATTSLFSTTPTISAAANEDSAAVFSPTTIDGAKYLRLYCTQKGSTEPGRDLSVQIWGKVYAEF